MTVTRRNFIGSLLAIGAGFAILPPAAAGRIWKVERKLFILGKELAGIWQFHYLSSEPRSDKPINRFANFGSIAETSSGLWYKTPHDWQPLEKLTHPLASPATRVFKENDFFTAGSCLPMIHGVIIPTSDLNNDGCAKSNLSAG